MPEQPIQLHPIPDQIVNAGASVTPIDLNLYIASPNLASGIVQFSASLADGSALPRGLSFSRLGKLTGTPAQAGKYQIMVMATNDAPSPLVVYFNLTVHPSVAAGEETVTTGLQGIADTAAKLAAEGKLAQDLKTRVWEALQHDMPVPAIGNLFTTPCTALEIYYLLQRFATFTIWNVYDLSLPGELHAMHLEGVSEHFNVFDRGSCLVATPKELFSHNRTLGDAINTAKAVVREAYSRGWTVEFNGFDKMMRAAWIEAQHLADQHGKRMDILHFTPSTDDLNLYLSQAKTMGMRAQS